MADYWNELTGNRPAKMLAGITEPTPNADCSLTSKAMAIKVEVKSEDFAVKSKREQATQNVLAQFGNQLPDLKLLCFFDDVDCDSLKKYIGEANRGVYTPVRNSQLWPHFPEYLKDYIFESDPSAFSWEPLFDHVIYLHGSTCSDEIGLTVTFAHELQHFVQHGDKRTRKLAAENTLIQNLDKELIEVLKLRWFDIPIEREARIVSKRTAEALFGAPRVRQFIATRITEATDEGDAVDWRFIQGIVPSTSYDLTRESHRIFQKLKPHWREFERLLNEAKDNPAFSDITLRDLFDDFTEA
jgi:hypothetical protein